MENLQQDLTLETLPKAFTRLINEVNEIKTLLLKKNNEQIHEPKDRWFDLEELRQYLPDKPAKQTIYGKVSNNEIPHYKDAKKLRFLKSEIDNWLMQGRKKTSIEIQAEIEANTDAFLGKRKLSSKN